MSAAKAAWVYLHGLPGGPDETALVGAEPNLYFAPPLDKGPLAEQLEQQFGNQPVRLIGFSLGAFRALRFAAAFPDRVASLHLVAPAPPLDLGDFLGAMAGGPIFRLARDHPTIFRLLTAFQARAAHWTPHWFARQIFEQAGGEEAQLTATAQFRQHWARLAQNALGRNSAAYRDEITAYVQPWANLLSTISTPVTIYFGGADTWVPAPGVRALAAALPHPPSLTCFPQAGHYSALAAALPLILSETDQSAFS